jgi:hypothetical protein
LFSFWSFYSVNFSIISFFVERAYGPVGDSGEFFERVFDPSDRTPRA